MLIYQPGFFDSQVLQIYAARDFLKQLSYSYTTIIKDDQVESVVAFTTRYLLQRPRPALDSSAKFPYLANYIVDKLMEYDHIDNPENNEKQRYVYMHAFCKYIEPRQILLSPDQPFSSESKQDAVFLTAIYLNKKDFIRDTLQSNSRQMDIRKMEHECLGTPLYAAIRGRHYDVVHELLELGVDVNKKPFLWYTIYEGCEDIARLMVQPQYGMDTSDRTFESAIVIAIQHNYSTLAWSLLDQLTILPERRFLLSEGLRAACRQGMVDIVNRLIDNGGDVNENHTNDGSSYQPSLLSQAAWTGKEEILHLLLKRGANVNVDGIKSIIAAAWGGHINTAQILINTKPQIQGLKGAINAHSILTRAMCSMKPEAVDFLRVFQEHGLIDIHNFDKDPSKAEEALVDLVVFAATLGHVEYLKIFHEEFGTGILDDDPMYSRFEYAPPIVCARSRYQDKVVQYLLSIGVKDVDPLDTCFAEYFRSGEWPVRPQPLLICPMPYRV